MVLSWNLYSDVELITNLTVEDLTFDSDSILVRLPKRSPTSSASESLSEEYEYCRVYANPIDDRLCPVVALGYSLWHHDFHRRLFPGDNQHQRFAPLLKKLVERETMFAVPGKVVVLNPGWLGPSSFWKGAKKRACCDPLAYGYDYDSSVFQKLHNIPAVTECQRLGSGLPLGGLDAPPAHFSKADTLPREIVRKRVGDDLTTECEDALILCLAASANTLLLHRQM